MTVVGELVPDNTLVIVDDDGRSERVREIVLDLRAINLPFGISWNIQTT